MEHISVVPVKVKQYDESRRCDVLRLVGFRATNGTDWKGPVRKVRQDAVADVSDRRAGSPSNEG